MPGKCGDCGWWLSNPIQPDRRFGYCTVEQNGVFSDESPVKMKSQTCRSHQVFEEIRPAFHDLMLKNQAPDGCQTCPAKANVYKSPLCLKSTFVSAGQPKLHYRKCSLMTAAMCRYGRFTDAMNKYLRGVQNGL